MWTATEFRLIQADCYRRIEPEWRAFGAALRVMQEAAAKRINELIVAQLAETAA